MSGVDCIGGPPLFALAWSPVPRGYALPGQGDRPKGLASRRSPPKQAVVKAPCPRPARQCVRYGILPVPIEPTVGPAVAARTTRAF